MGAPAAIASSNTMPKLSWPVEGAQNASAAAPRPVLVNEQQGLGAGNMRDAHGGLDFELWKGSDRPIRMRRLRRAANARCGPRRPRRNAMRLPFRGRRCLLVFVIAGRRFTRAGQKFDNDHSTGKQKETRKELVHVFGGSASGCESRNPNSADQREVHGDAARSADSRASARRQQRTSRARLGFVARHHLYSRLAQNVLK